MKNRWTCRYKTNELRDLKLVNHRSRIVAKGYIQVQGLYYFENYAPGAFFITIRLLIALTSIPGPNFKVPQYDVSVAFIQSKLDANHTPVYCECAEGYKDRRKYVYLLHLKTVDRLHRLYGMKDSPRGEGQLFKSVCTVSHASKATNVSSSDSSTIQRVESKTYVQTWPTLSKPLPSCPRTIESILTARTLQQ